MQPPPLHPPSPLPVAISVWALGMAVLSLAVWLRQPALLGLMVLAVGPLYFFAQQLPPPRAAVRALQASGLSLAFEDGVVRTTRFQGRQVRLYTPRGGHGVGAFRVSISHVLPLADHTWVAWNRTQSTSRHAPWDLRTRLLPLLDDAPSAVRQVTLTDEHLVFMLPRSDASALTQRLADCADFTERLELDFVQTLVQVLVDSGFALDALSFGQAGEIGFQARIDDRHFDVRFGRYRDGVAHWRGRPELRICPLDGSADNTHVIIGPCTRRLVPDLRRLRRHLR